VGSRVNFEKAVVNDEKRRKSGGEKVRVSMAASAVMM